MRFKKTADWDMHFALDPRRTENCQADQSGLPGYGQATNTERSFLVEIVNSRKNCIMWR
jgi:hypothetical protein